MSTALFVAAAVVVAVLFFSQRPGPLVSAEEAQKLVENGAMLVDVRTPAEFSSGHIDGAINVPLDQLEARLDDLLPKSRALVLYCRSGARSGRAKRMLEGHGFAEVVNLGGMSRWR